MSADLTVALALARMLFPERRGAASTTAAVAGELLPVERWPELLAAAERNKLPLLWFQPEATEWAPFFASEAFRRARVHQQHQCERQRREYETVRRTLSEAGIPGVMIKSVGRAPSWPYTSDNADMLVPLAAGDRARDLLRSLGYVEVVNVEEPCKYLFRTFRGGASLSAIHLHEFVGWGTGFMEDAAVLAAARPAPDDASLLIPAPSDALLITLAHAFYEDKDVKLSDLAKVLHLLAQGPLDWARCWEQARARGWEDGLATCLLLWSALEQRLFADSRFPPEELERARAAAPVEWDRLQQLLAVEDLRFPFRVPFGLSKRLYYRKVRRDTRLSAGAKALDATRHTLAGLKRRLPFRSQRPMLVTLSGIDGSGKSAHARALVRAFETCEVSVRSVWSRGGSSRLTDLAIALARPLVHVDAAKAPAGAQRADSVQRKRAWMKRPLLRAGWAWLVTLDLLAQYAWRITWPLVRGRVVVSDRYTYDALIELAALTGSTHVCDALTSRLLRALTPRPRCAYLLDVAPQQALARKPDETLDFLTEQAQAYRSMAERWGLRVVSTDADFNSASDTIVHAVLTEYYRDWHTLIGALFMTNPKRRRAAPAADEQAGD
jgi:thymidylate kinase